jgi:hypothetical protein
VDVGEQHVSTSIRRVTNHKFLQFGLVESNVYLDFRAVSSAVERLVYTQ